jgi:hypothetical protein
MRRRNIPKNLIGAAIENETAASEDGEPMIFPV